MRRRRAWAVLVGGLLLLAGAPARAFDYYEHVYLGELVCAVLKGFTPSDGVVPLACLERPDDIAIAADHAEKIPDLDDARGDDARKNQVERQGQEVRSWLAGAGCWTCLRDGDVLVLRRILSAGTAQQQLLQLGKELEPEMRLRHRPADAKHDDLDTETETLLNRAKDKRPACFTPSKSLEDGFAGLSGYVELATENHDHFGWDAQDNFLKYAAVPENEDARAFAYHFLTDSYAAGHVRTERRALAPFPSKIAHDWDNRNGLEVGQSFFVMKGGLPADHYVLYWRTYGDRCLLTGEGRATRILAAFAMIQAAPRSVAPGETLRWTRPLALTRNAPPISEYREHFNGVIGAGTLIPFETDAVGPTPMVRAKFELEYYTPMSETVMLTGSLQLNASRQIVLTPAGIGYHWPNFLAKLGPALRWATDRSLFEVGLEGEAGWCWAPFPTMELRAVVVATPFMHLQRSQSELSMRQDVSFFFQLGYRIDR